MATTTTNEEVRAAVVDNDAHVSGTNLVIEFVGGLVDMSLLSESWRNRTARWKRLLRSRSNNPYPANVLVKSRLKAYKKIAARLKIKRSQYRKKVNAISATAAWKKAFNLKRSMERSTRRLMEHKRFIMSTIYADTV
jgi:hypothetical protein